MEFLKEHVLDPDPLRCFQPVLYIHILVPAGPGWDDHFYCVTILWRVLLKALNTKVTEPSNSFNI
jgi:hypothetical protein